MPLPAHYQRQTFNFTRPSTSQKRHLTGHRRRRIVPAFKMAFARTILAFLIALSVVMLPATGGAAFKLKLPDGSEQVGVEMSAVEPMSTVEPMSAVEPMDDCCPHAANPCGQAMDNCGSMATCALTCLSFAGGFSSPLNYSLTLATTMPLFDSGGFRAQTNSPPFRPPRV
jgi:hypothetical protein